MSMKQVGYCDHLCYSNCKPSFLYQLLFFLFLLNSVIYFFITEEQIKMCCLRIQNE